MDKKHEFSEGDAVRINKGAFASYFGKVVGVDNKNQRLTVLGRREAETGTDLHTLNVAFSVVEKLSLTQAAETILVVEDDESVRSLVKEVLADAGYQVLEAASGAAALSICARHENPIHLLLTDVVMPEMSGRELSDLLTRIRTGMKVLYMSGYPDESIVHHGVLDEEKEFIQKPFGSEILARKVREVLDSSGKPPQPKK
jgi:CheY-like chemotaxis protein